MFERGYRFSTNDSFEDWRIVKPAGRGAYGEVYLAEDITGKRLALKILFVPTLREDPTARELDSLSRYRTTIPRNDNLVQVFHAGKTSEGLVYYTMEAADDLGIETGSYVPDTLENRLKWQKKPLTEEILTILLGILNGLAVLHKANVSHRDLKPGNIIFVQNVPKLADIGLLSSSADPLFRPGGTRDFLPPEVRDGTVCGSGNQTSVDLFAAGMVLYCLMTGQAAEEYPIIPKDVPVKTIQILRPLYAKACNSRPARRFQSADEFSRAIEMAKKNLNVPPINRFRQIVFVLVALAFVLTVPCCMKSWYLYRSVATRVELILHENNELEKLFFPNSFMPIDQIEKRTQDISNKNPDWLATRAINEMLITLTPRRTPQLEKISNHIYLMNTGLKGKMYYEYENQHNRILGLEDSLNKEDNRMRDVLIRKMIANPIPVVWILSNRGNVDDFTELMNNVSAYESELAALPERPSVKERITKICEKYSDELELYVASRKDWESVCVYMLQFYPSGVVPADLEHEFELKLESVRNQNLTKVD